jgi:hypothetical protein
MQLEQALDVADSFRPSASARRCRSARSSEVSRMFTLVSFFTQAW